MRSAPGTYVGATSGGKMLLLVALVVFAGTLNAPAATGPTRFDARSALCFPHGSRTLLENRHARVYRAFNSFDERKYTNYKCVFAQAEPLPLDGDGVWAFPPPAMALDGPVLGFAEDDCRGEENPGPCQTSVVVEDLT